MIKKNLFYNLLLSLSQVIFPLITFPYIARTILPEGVGVVSFVDSVCRYVVLFSALGIPIYGVREVAKAKSDQNQLSKLFNELISINLIFTFLVLLLYTYCIIVIPKLNENLIFYLIGFLFIFSNVFIAEWFFQGVEEFKYITKRNLVIKIISTISIFLFVKTSNDALLYFFILVLVNTGNAVVNYNYIKNKFKIKFVFTTNSIQKHIKPLFFVFGSLVFISVYTLLDSIMLGIFSTNHAVGIYTTGLKIARIPMTFIGALGVVLIPRLSEYHEFGNFFEFKQLIKKSINFVITFSVPIFILIIALSKEVVIAFAGISFKDSALVLNILSLLGILIGFSNVFGLQILTPMSKDKYLTISVAIGTLISICLNILLIPKLHEIGAAISNVTAETAVTLATFYFARRFIKISFEIIYLLKTFFLFIPLFFIAKLVSHFFANIWIIISIVAVVSTFYFIFVQILILKNSLFDEVKKKLNYDSWNYI